MAEDLDARAQLAEALWNDPETRPAMAKLIKAKFPKAQIPEHDVREAGEQVLSQVRTELAQDRAERIAERQRRDLEAARQSIIDAGLGTAEDIPAIEKLMTEELIGTHKTAAEVYRSRRAVAEPRSARSLTMDIPGVRGAGGDFFKGIVEDPDAWGRSKSDEILTDFANGRGSKWM